MAMARLDHDEGRLAEAQAAVSRVLAARPRDVAARLLAARLLDDLGDAQGARAALDTLAVAAHANPEVLLEAARLHTATGDLAGARQFLDDASKLPGAQVAQQAREAARLALAEGRPRDAAELLSGEGGDPESSLLLLEARLGAAAEDLAVADATAAEIARRFPGQAVESLAAGRVALARGDGAAARAAFAAALARLEAGGGTPREVAEAHLLLGQAHDLAGAAEEALASYQRAARLTPSAAAPGFFIGRSLLAKGDVAGALDTLARAVKADPTHAEARFRLAEAALAQRRPALARQSLEAYLQLAPHGPLAERAHRMLRQM
jgi:tetratricopeptide (TPR) repeat protein